MKSLTLPTLLLISLAGCTPSEEDQLKITADAAKKSIAAHFKDPDSIKYQDVVFDWQKKYICGKLNAKNGYGAYTGYDSFRAELVGKGKETTVIGLRSQKEESEQLHRDVQNLRNTTPNFDIKRMAEDFSCVDEKLFSEQKTPIKIPE